jgi:hypothetical protein
MATANVTKLNVSTNKLTVSGSTKSHNKVTKEKPQAIVKVPHSFVLDFSTCSPAEIMELAKDGVVVKLQSRTRNTFFAKENMREDGKTPKLSFAKIATDIMSGTINVKTAIVEKSRGPGINKVAKTEALFKGMSPEEKAATMKLLASMK